MKIAAGKGANLKRKCASTISFSEEEELWKECFGHDNPEKLQNTLFYLNGIHFALRGRDEHCNLTIDQIKVETRNGKKCIVYTEKSSKNNPGGLRCVRYNPKQVVHYEIDEKRRCHVALFEKFLQVRPPNVDRFYLLPSKKVGSWFTNRPLGKNTISQLLKKLFQKANIQQMNVSNHSLRATCATRLYQANVDEQIIMERTGHRSVAGVRAYKHTSDIHIQNSSAILDGRSLQSLASTVSQQNTDASNCSSSSGTPVNFFIFQL